MNVFICYGDGIYAPCWYYWPTIYLLIVLITFIFAFTLSYFLKRKEAKNGNKL